MAQLRTRAQRNRYISKPQAEQVQQHTGVDPEELTDQELAQTMDELGIDKQEVTDADQDAE